MNRLDTTRKYELKADDSAQTVAYALAEYLDVKKNMITQTMRSRNGYTVQCKGDASAEWTKYIGLDAALTIDLTQNGNVLEVTIGTDKWVEKAGIALLGSFIFSPLMFTAGAGAVRQFSLLQDIYSFVEAYLGVKPLEESDDPISKFTTSFNKFSDEVQDGFKTFTEVDPTESTTVECPHCGSSNPEDAHFCKNCGEDLKKVAEKEQCDNCGAELDGDEAFCPYCGHKLH